MRVTFGPKHSGLKIFSVLAMLYARYLSSFQIRNAIGSTRLIRHMKRNASAQKNGSVGNLRSLNEFGLGTNTLTHYLLGDEVELKDGSQVYPKQLRKKHFVPVLPEKVPTPSFIAASKSCAHMLELDPAEFQKKQFTEVFSGNELLPGLDVPYATVYGCHSFGQWFGQLGDGRALSIGDVYIIDPPNEDFHRDQFKNPPSQPAPTKELAYGDHLQELQLKGCGRSPFSRGFDGRAVLRSSVREYLVSEAMYHLGVPTTRALSLVSTGMEIARPWYAATSTCNNYTPPQPTINNSSIPHTAPTSSNASCITPLRKFAPDYLLREPGAVLCRVSRSFLRVGQLELFAMRREYEELTQLADFVCFREFPELLKIGESPGVKVDRITGEVSAAEGVGNADAGTVPPTTNGSSTSNSEASLLFDTMDNSTAVAPTTTTTTATTATTTTTDSTTKVPALPESLVPGPPERYVEMFRLIAQRNAALVADWLRVGYVQGNMNSDNTLLAGRTIDYGPYGWMERYDPLYQPFTTDRAGNFAFSRQPAAMGLNVGVLGETTIAPLVQHVYMTNVQAGRTPLHTLEHYLDQVTHIFEVEYAQCFGQAYDEVKRRKLGLFAFDSGAKTTAEESTCTTEDQQLWLDLELLMAASDVDFTILFRELGKVAEVLVGPDMTHSEPATSIGPGSSTSTTSTSTSAGSSRAATMFVPATAELSLFPNIPFATEQSQTEPGHSSPAAQSAATVSPDRSVVDSSAPVAGELEDLLLDRALALLGPAFYNPEKLQETRPVVFNTATSTALTAASPVATNTSSDTDNPPLNKQWTAWLHRYQHRLLQDTQTGVMTVQERRKMMDATNPKYVLRNWMAAMAYERSEQGDHTIIHELSALLEQPYDEQSIELQQRWYAKTPDWAQNLPGVTFMSCSS
eukprot:gene17719-20186_t